MIQQITRGIKITVKTCFQGTFTKDRKLHFAFRYHITIKNQSNDSVQFNSRWWHIKEVLSESETTIDKGLSGKKMVLKPGESHTYSNGCLLTSPFGLIHGHFNMVNFTSTRKFKVFVPKFRLSVPFALN